MKKVIVFFLFLAGLNGRAQVGNVSYPGRVHPGEEITLSCRHDPARVVVYVYDTLYRWHVYEQQVGRFIVPGSAGFLAYRFLYNGKADNNHDTGYFSMVVLPTGAYAAGAEAGYGLLRSPAYGEGVPGYFDHFTISDTATYMWLSNEILRHQGGRSRLALPYLKAAVRFRPERAPGEMRNAVRYFIGVKDSAGEAILTAYLICERLLKDTVRADSLQRVILAGWPSGGLARRIAYERVVHSSSPMDTTPAVAFLKAFPYRASDFEENKLLGIDYYAVYRRVLSVEIAGQHPEVVLKYVDDLPFMNLAEAYYKVVEIPYDDWKKADAKTAFPYSEALYRRMLYYYDHQPAEYWYYAPSEWKAFFEKTFENYFRLHARILMEVGRSKEALALAQRAQISYRFRSADLNQTEALLLSGASLDSVLLNSVRVNQVTPVMLDMLRRSYISRHGSDQGFEGWVESLKGAEARVAMEIRIREAALRMAAPGFELRDGHGKLVRLDGLRGKVVVLDFWATWCAPCKAAMAGMKLAKDRYKEDTNVVFYFIDTQERLADYRARGQAFLKERGYDFDVLYDSGDKMDEAYGRYAAALHTSGIPFKAIIDRNGVLRFSNVGYMGSPSGLADEMCAMINEAKGDSIFYTHDSIRIGATLTCSGIRGATAIVILSGTGKQDRDGTMAGHKLFKVLADSLVRKGFVVLRSDDRGVGASNGNYELSTTEDFARDALAAVHYLRGRTDLGIGRIGLLGHSEGGMAAAIAAVFPPSGDFRA